MLLPNNSSLIEQQFASYLDDNSKVNYEDLKIDVMTCDISLLPHLALIKGANIDNMLEVEARLHIKNFIKKNIGTRGAVEDTINVFYQDAQLIEWFENDDIPKGMFDIDVKISNNINYIYDERLFKRSRQSINEAKNVRSKLKKISLKLPNANTNINEFTGGVFGVNLKSELQMNSKTNITLKGGAVWII
jgi:P2-related tail formation protein